MTATDTTTPTISGVQNVTVTPGAAHHLTFAVQPSATTSGATISPSPTVRIQDAYGNLTPSNATVSMTLTAGPAGATLSGSTTRAAAAGVATFNNLTVNTAGVGYRLTASSGPLPPTASTPFTVSAGPAQTLVLTGLSDPTTAGIPGSVTATARDAYGNTSTAYAGTVHFTTTDPAATLPADYTFVAADAGTHTFSNAVVLKTAGSRSVTATETTTPTMTGVQNVTVTAGAADHLAFGVQPSGTASGATISPSPTVRIEDAYGNLTGSTANVALTLTGGPAGATLSGTTTVAAAGGLASFNDLAVDRAGVGYRLTASSTTLTATISTTFSSSGLVRSHMGLQHLRPAG